MRSRLFIPNVWKAILLPRRARVRRNSFEEVHPTKLPDDSQRNHYSETLNHPDITVDDVAHYGKVVAVR
jgi:hypothetical protein